MMADVASRMVAMDGAGAGPGGQVAGHGEGLGGKRGEPDLVAPAGEERHWVV